MSPKIIKDPVHGYVEVDEEILPILDAPAIQRLRYIRQLGFSYLVYPGANHTRFEHSVGYDAPGRGRLPAVRSCG